MSLLHQLYHWINDAIKLMGKGIETLFRIVSLGQLNSLTIKKFLPKTLMGRSLMIVVLPVFLTQALVTWIFFDLHWRHVTQRLSESVAGDVALITELYVQSRETTNNEQLFELAKAKNKLSVDVMQNQTLPERRRSGFFSFLDQALREELIARIDGPIWINTTSYREYVDIRVQVGEDVLRFIAFRDRVYATNWHIFLFWMVVTTLILLSVSLIFIRNQMRSITALADAAEAYGAGRQMPRFKPTGAAEVRKAAHAFLKMRGRIERFVAQRTAMLAGVSHDLRTPLTRLKLHFALQEPSEENKAAAGDISEMETLLDDYLEFARGEAGEPTEPVNLHDLTAQILSDLARGHQGRKVGFHVPAELKRLFIPGRAGAMRRGIINLIDNALGYGRTVEVSVGANMRQIWLDIEDDGPGIPADQIQLVFTAFTQLESGNKEKKGRGVGLGLAIAKDVARAHGGDVELDSSAKLGGLRARLWLPRGSE